MKTLRYTFLLSLLAIFVVSSCSDNSTSPATTEDFTGYVFDSAEKPVKDAKVELFDAKTELITSDITNDKGMFTLKSIPINKEGLRYRVTHEIFATQTGNFAEFYENHKAEKGKSPVVFKLMEKDSCCGIINITVLDYESDEPLENVEVKITKNDEFSEIKHTNANGSVKFEELCKGKYWLRVALEGYQVKEDYFYVENCDPKDLTIKLKKKEAEECCNNTLNLLVMDEDNKPIAETKVLLYRDGKLVHDGYTNNDGKVSFSELCKGKYGVAIKKQGFKIIEYTVTFECEEVVSHEKVLVKEQSGDCCDNSLELIVQDDDKNPIKDAIVLLYLNGKVVKEGKTNADGKVKFEEICKGKYGVVVKKEGYKAIEFQQSFDCKENISYTKTLSKEQSGDCCDNSLELIIQDDDKNPIKDAIVLLYLNGKVVKEGKTNADGKVKFEEICKGKYGVVVKKEGYKAIEFQQSFDCKENISYTKTLSKEQSGDCCGELQIIVTDKSTNNPIANAEVKITRADNQYTNMLKTNSSGEVVFEKLCLRKYWVRIAHGEFNVLEDYVYIENCDKPVAREFKLEPKKTTEPCCDNNINFEILDGNGSEVHGAKIQMRRNGKVIYQYETKSGKVSTGEKICKGEYVIVVSKSGLKTIEFVQELDCAENITISKTLYSK